MKLHIGCLGAKIEGFKRLDAQQYGDVDYVQNAKDLSNFADGSVEEIYASHIFEHFTKLEVDGVLKEWRRVLVDGGVLHMSVPDFDAIVEMYLRLGKTMNTWLDHLLHGDQAHPYAFHYSCFTFNTLSGLLSKSGFTRIDRAADLPYGIRDASKTRDCMFNLPISLNIKAIK